MLALLLVPLAVVVTPNPPLLEHARGRFVLSCDLRVDNPGAVPLTIEAIELSAFDGGGALIARRRVDAHGVSPAIATLPNRVVPARGALTVFNPLDTLDDDVTPATVELRVTLSAPDGTARTLGTRVAPKVPDGAPLTLPLAGRVLVANGHGYLDPHRRIDLDAPPVRAVGLRANSARYAVDLAIIDAAGALHRGSGERLGDWRGFGATVSAPAAGTVVALVDGVPDNGYGADGVHFAPDRGAAAGAGGAILGNHVVLDHGDGRFSLLAHLERGSFAVHRGDRVAAGAPLARVGFSGDTDFVHLHYQLQSAADVLVAEGLPAIFSARRRGDVYER
jgi:hypothetical protein